MVGCSAFVMFWSIYGNFRLCGRVPAGIRAIPWPIGADGEISMNMFPARFSTFIFLFYLHDAPLRPPFATLRPPPPVSGEPGGCVERWHERREAAFQFRNFLGPSPARHRRVAGVGRELYFNCCVTMEAGNTEAPGALFDRGARPGHPGSGSQDHVGTDGAVLRLARIGRFSTSFGPNQAESCVAGTGQCASVCDS